MTSFSVRAGRAILGNAEMEEGSTLPQNDFWGTAGVAFGSFGDDVEEHMLQQMFDLQHMAMVSQAVGRMGTLSDTMPGVEARVGVDGEVAAGKGKVLEWSGSEDEEDDVNEDRFSTDVKRVRDADDANNGKTSHETKKALNRLAQRRYRKRKKEKAQELDAKAKNLGALQTENQRLLTTIENLQQSLKMRDQDLSSLREHNEKLFSSQAQLFSVLQHGSVAPPVRVEERPLLTLLDSEGIQVNPSTEDLFKRIEAAVKRIRLELSIVDEEYKLSIPDAVARDLGIRVSVPKSMSPEVEARESGSMSEENDSLLRCDGSRASADFENAQCMGSDPDRAGSCDSMSPNPVCIGKSRTGTHEKGVLKAYSTEDMDRMSKSMEPYVQALFRLREEITQMGPCAFGTSKSCAPPAFPDSTSLSHCDLVRKWRHVVRTLRITHSQAQRIVQIRENIFVEGSEIYTRREELLTEALDQTRERSKNIAEFHRRNMINMMSCEATVLNELKSLLQRELKLQDMCKDILNILTAWQISRMICETYPSMPDCFYLSTTLKHMIASLDADALRGSSESWCDEPL